MPIVDKLENTNWYKEENFNNPSFYHPEKITDKIWT